VNSGSVVGGYSAQAPADARAPRSEITTQHDVQDTTSYRQVMRGHQQHLPAPENNTLAPSKPVRGLDLVGDLAREFVISKLNSAGAESGPNSAALHACRRSARGPRRVRVVTKARAPRGSPTRIEAGVRLSVEEPLQHRLDWGLVDFKQGISQRTVWVNRR